MPEVDQHVLRALSARAFLGFAVALVITTASSQGRGDREIIQAKALGVAADGAPYVVHELAPGKRLKVCLWGIKLPSERALVAKAREKLVLMVTGHSLRVLPIEKGSALKKALKKGHISGIVYVLREYPQPSDMLQERLLWHGLAFLPSGKESFKELKPAEDQAKAVRRGLWAKRPR